MRILTWAQSALFTCLSSRHSPITGTSLRLSLRHSDKDCFVMVVRGHPGENLPSRQEIGLTCGQLRSHQSSSLSQFPHFDSTSKCLVY